MHGLSGSIASAERAESLRIATFAAPLSRDGPALLLRDLTSGTDPQVAAIVAAVNHIAPDILLLTNFDYDLGGAALAAFSDQLAVPYPHHFAFRPNAGLQTGLDVDGDGFTGDARDALGYGRFFGDGGMAVLSQFPIDAGHAHDLTATRWRDVPNAVLPRKDGAAFPSDAVLDVFPVSSNGHWIVPIDVGAAQITLLTMAATPPVFDGLEDFNGLRNRDELRLFEAVLDGRLGDRPDRPILLGSFQIDPFDGQGLRDGINDVLARDDLQDPQPRSDGARQMADATHRGDPALDTVDWSDDGAGNLRVSYVLPSADLNVIDAGVFWPTPEDRFADLLGPDGFAAGANRLVWVDIARPR